MKTGKIIHGFRAKDGREIILRTPKWEDLDELVTKGTYRISKNPVCLSGFLGDAGIGIACASWLFLLYAIVDIILMHISLGAEERFLLEKYWNAYREYMNRTPRWIGIPKSRKSD